MYTLKPLKLNFNFISFFSIIFLLINWIIHTLPNFQDLVELQSMIDSNVYICKMMNYFHSVCRCMFSMTTFCYSLERALAIFLPFKIIKIKSRVTGVFIILIFLVSFLSPLQYIYSYKLVRGYVHNNISIVVCTVKPTILEYFEKFSFFFNLFFVYLPIFFVILLNFSILIKLKNYKLEITTELSKGLSTQLLKILNQLYEENFMWKKINSTNTNGTMFDTVTMRNHYLRRSMPSKSSCILPNSSLCTQNLANPSELHSLNRRLGKSIVINQKFTNTNTLIMISMVYIVLNIPNLINLFIIFNPFSENKTNIKIKVQNDISIASYLLFSEAANIAIYCINGLLFILFGKAFRIHLKKIWYRLRKD